MTILGKPYGISAIEVIPPVSSRGPARWQVRWDYYNPDGARRQASRKRFRNEEDCQTYITKALLPASKREHMLLADGKYIPITEGQTDQEETMASKSPVRDKILEYLKDKPAGYHMKVTSVARATRLTKQQVDACLGHMMRDMPELGIKRVTTGVYDYDPEAAAAVNGHKEEVSVKTALRPESTDVEPQPMNELWELLARGINGVFVFRLPTGEVKLLWEK